MSKIFIPVILGTARKGRKTEAAARFVLELVQESGVKTELVDVREYGQSATIVDWMDGSTAVTAQWIKKATAADGFIIVSPEYNHMFPGELKIFLDQTLKPYRHKPAGLAVTSSGQWGGTRVAEYLRAYTSRLGMIAIHPAAYFPHIGEAFDEAGNPTDPKTAERTKPMIDEVLWYARALSNKS